VKSSDLRRKKQMHPDLHPVERHELGANADNLANMKPVEAGRGRIRGFLAGLVIGAMIAFAAFHIAPLAHGKAMHDLREYGQ